MTATVVDWGKLLGVALTALVAGTGVTLLYSLAVLGVARAGDRTAGGRGRVAYAALAVLCVAASAAAVVYGVVLLTRK